jgi:hypothetical protein
VLEVHLVREVREVREVLEVPEVLEFVKTPMFLKCVPHVLHSCTYLQ